MSYRAMIAKTRPVVETWARSFPGEAKGAMSCPCCGALMQVERLRHDGGAMKTAAHCATAFCVNWID